MIDPLDVATKYSGARPGFELVHFEEVGLPYFQLFLDTLVQHRKPIGPIDEFVLRAVDAGVDNLDDVSGLLGLERSLIEQSVIDLNRVDHLDYRLEGDARVLRLTPLGDRALQGWIDLTPDRTEYFVGFDRLTWRVTGRHYRDLLRPRDARKFGLAELPSKLKRRIDPSDLDLEETQRAVGEVVKANLEGTDLIAVKDARNIRMVLPAVALVYAPDNGSTEGDQQVAIAIDGRLSEEHGIAFANIDGPARAGLVVEAPAPPGEGSDLPADVGLRRADRSKVAALEKVVADASIEFDRSVTATATAASLGDGPGTSLSEAQAVEERSRDALQIARAQLAELPIRSIQTYEHATILSEALRSASERLLIISPWIRGAVVDSEFVQSLRGCAERGVSVHIGWGIGGGDDDQDRDPVVQLDRLAAQYSNVVLQLLGNTHAKILIWDDRLVVTSFNWLSFRGDKRRRFRQEEGTLITEPGYVNQEYEKYSRQITDADPRP